MTRGTNELMSEMGNDGRNYVQDVALHILADNVSGTPAASLFRADAAMTAACSHETYLPLLNYLLHGAESFLRS